MVGVERSDVTNLVNLRDVVTADDFDRFLDSRPCVPGPRGRCACCELTFDAARTCARRVEFAFALLAMPSLREIVATSGCVGSCSTYDCGRCLTDRVRVKATALRLLES